MLKRRLSYVLAALCSAAPALADQMTPAVLNDLSSLTVKGVGAANSSTLAARATYGGVRLDLRNDFGAACDGATDDSAALSRAMSALKATATQVTLTFPGACVIAPSYRSIPGWLNFEGVGGGGLKFASGSSLGNGTTAMFQWSGPYPISVKNMTVDLNGDMDASGGIATIFYFTNASTDFEGNTIKNSGSIPAVAGSGLIYVKADNQNGSLFRANSFVMQPSIYYTASIVLTGSSNTSVDSNVANGGNIESFSPGTNLTFNFNKIFNWAFGSGIGMSPNGTVDSTDHHIVVMGNQIGPSAGTGVDVNGDIPGGMESNYGGMFIANNDISNTCGPGIKFANIDQIVDNKIVDVGTCNVSAYYNSAIANYTWSGGPTDFSSARITGNTAYQVSGSNMSYGYYQTTGTTAGPMMGVNYFSTALGNIYLGAATVQSMFVGGGTDTAFTGTCAINSQSGGHIIGLTWSGKFAANGACVGGTYILNFQIKAPHGWACDFKDITTPADAINQTAFTATTATLAATTASADVILGKCQAF